MCFTLGSRGVVLYFCRLPCRRKTSGFSRHFEYHYTADKYPQWNKLRYVVDAAVALLALCIRFKSEVISWPRCSSSNCVVGIIPIPQAEKIYNFAKLHDVSTHEARYYLEGNDFDAEKCVSYGRISS